MLKFEYKNNFENTGGYNCQNAHYELLNTILSIGAGKTAAMYRA
jgi:hypothetical protein